MQKELGRYLLPVLRKKYKTDLHLKKYPPMFLRLKKKKERNLEVYRKRNTEETIEAARKRYHERRLERKMAGRPI